MKVSNMHACLLRKLRVALRDRPDEWRQFCIFHRSTRFTGSNFETLSLEQLAELSRWCDKARQ